MQQDTFHQYMGSMMQAEPLTPSARVDAISRAWAKPVHNLGIFTSIGESVEFSKTREGQRDLIKIYIPQYSESGEYCGEGFYSILTTPTGEGVGGHTEYAVNGRRVRNCRLTPDQAQMLADKVFAEVLKRA